MLLFSPFVKLAGSIYVIFFLFFSDLVSLSFFLHLAYFPKSLFAVCTSWETSFIKCCLSLLLCKAQDWCCLLPGFVSVMRLSGNASISMAFHLTTSLRLFVFSCNALCSCNTSKSFSHFHHSRFHRFPHCDHIFWSTKPNLPWQFCSFISLHFLHILLFFSVGVSALDQGPG